MNNSYEPAPRNTDAETGLHAARNLVSKEG